tara:strand:+ start:945 stop:1793 length:849 start_codon:yes stop_codon:yes gene_type:complete
MKLSNILKEAEDILSKSDINNHLKESKLIISHVLCSGLEVFILEPEKDITSIQKNRIRELIKRRAKGEPVAYLKNSINFYKDFFYVNNSVLIPRPETEELIETVLKNIPNKNIRLNILDIGIGSGIILASLLKELPNAFGVGTDISIEALKVANKNLHNLNIIKRSKLINSNWSEGTKNNIFDIITCNPPYISNEYIKNLCNQVKNYEPLLALNGGINGLESYKELLPLARNAIKVSGLLALEIGFDQSQKLESILYKNKFLLKEVRKDLSGNNRVLLAEPF